MSSKERSNSNTFQFEFSLRYAFLTGGNFSRPSWAHRLMKCAIFCGFLDHWISWDYIASIYSCSKGELAKKECDLEAK